VSEANTRKLLIDHHLKTAGWNVNDYTQVVKEYSVISKVKEPSSDYGTTFSDYILLGKDGKALAVVEAKRTSKDAEIGREQARQYCVGIKEETGILPFCFYTNESIFSFGI
jgi:type I restriction enzyme R subunit